MEIAETSGKNTRVSRRRWPAASQLNADRAKLVRDYMPLIRSHIRRRVKCQPDGSRRCPDDLFQEGCLGLIRAALRFDPAAGIPFAVFARPRIRGAVNRALDVMDNVRSVTVPDVLRIAMQHPRRDMEEDVEGTILRGEKLEVRIEQSLRNAVQMLDDHDDPHRRDTNVECAGDSAVRTTNDGNGELDRRLRAMVSERMLQVDGEDGRSLREIMRETGAAYSRVRRCVRELQTATRQLLAADPQVPSRLRHWAKRFDDELRARSARHDPMAGKCKISPEERLELRLQGKRKRQRRYRALLRTRIGVVRKRAKTQGKTRLRTRME